MTWAMRAEGLTAVPASQVQVPKPDVVITSFEALVSDAAALKALSWDFVIMDERTRLQSALSRAYQAVYGVHCRARAIVAHSSLLKTVSILASCPLCPTLPSSATVSCSFPDRRRQRLGW